MNSSVRPEPMPDSSPVGIQHASDHKREPLSAVLAGAAAWSDQESDIAASSSLCRMALGTSAGLRTAGTGSADAATGVCSPERIQKAIFGENQRSLEVTLGADD